MVSGRWINFITRNPSNKNTTASVGPFYTFRLFFHPETAILRSVLDRQFSTFWSTNKVQNNYLKVHAEAMRHAPRFTSYIGLALRACQWIINSGINSKLKRRTVGSKLIGYYLLDFLKFFIKTAWKQKNYLQTLLQIWMSVCAIKSSNFLHV